MKRIISFLVFCLCLAVVGSLLITSVKAQKNSSKKNQKKKNQEKVNNSPQKMSGNQTLTDPPARSPQQLEILQRLIQQARADGSVRAIIGVRDFAAQDELLRQLAPFQVTLVTRYWAVPYLTLDVNEAALIFLRDSSLVTTIGENLAGTTAGGQTAPPAWSPEQLAIFQRLNQQLTTDDTVRVIVGLRVSFTPEGYLPPAQRQTQREFVSNVVEMIS
jgi:hypothetical protein